MNRIDALTYAFNDATRPANEREAALAALRSLVTDGADPAERQQAQRALATLERDAPLTEAEQRAVDLCGPLGLDLLRFPGAHELSEVTWRDLIRFAESREWPGKWDNSSLKSLWNSWIVWGCPDFRQRIWDAIKEKFATDQERRAEFARLDREYPLFGLSTADRPDELEMYERHLNSSDPHFMLAHARQKLAETPEYYFRTREVAGRIIKKLTENKDGKR